MKRNDLTIFENGRSIPVTEFISSDGPVTVALHGFGGDRNSSVIRRLAEKSGNVVCFDLPCHGDSTAPDGLLTVENCLLDLEAVISYVREKYEGREIRFFATSFGGYLLLLSLHLIKEGERIVLRAPAVNMAETFLSVIAEMTEDELYEKGSVVCGFERRIDVSAEFYTSLKRFDSFASCDRPLLVIHGGRDGVVTVSDIDRYMESHPSAVLYRMADADHRFKGNGQVDELIDAAMNWFACENIVKKH